MKFGAYLESQIDEQWREHYLNYNELKKIISALHTVAADVDVGKSGGGERVTSLTMVPKQETEAIYKGKTITEADFFNLLESEMKKLDEFVVVKLKKLKKDVDELAQKAVNNKSKSEIEKKGLEIEVKTVGASFLKLEKFVNLNYLGIHKILKKHDKMLPVPCRRYYLTRLQSQQWVKKDHSKIFVRLSQIHSNLRGDVGGKKTDTTAQGFVRSTTKYWVRTKDISKVKYIVLQHLPVFQHDLEALSGDSQLTNSVYFDNTQLELYHGRIEKTPGAIALRLRWYESEEPKLVFVERKTHNDSWTGDLSVKERFTLNESQVMPFLRGEYTLEDKVAEMRAKGKSEADIKEVSRLFTEYQTAIDSKQLQPTMRTQYMRVAYQIPFDASVRISLDTNLTMICENPKNGPACYAENRWYRDPSIPLPNDEFTRFPHAVLEVKLSLKEGEDAPLWVSDLINSGMLTEVHKFSKFVHGCAVMLTEQIQFAPYWIDDESIRQSILRSQTVNAKKSIRGAAKDKPVNNVFQNDLLAKETISLMSQRNSFDIRSPHMKPVKVNGYGSFQPVAQGSTYAHGDEGAEHVHPSWWCWPWSKEADGYRLIPRKTPMKIEPKVFFANERTFLSWLHMSITLGSIAAGMLGFSFRLTGATKGDPASGNQASHLVGMILMPVSLIFACYALATFRWRGKRIHERVPDQMFNDMMGPTFLACILICALSAIFVLFLAGGVQVKV